MLRTTTEIKLLIIRQQYTDLLETIMAKKLIKLDFYKYIRVRLIVCNELLTEYRQTVYGNGVKIWKV